MKNRILLLLIAFYSFAAFGQTKEEREKIAQYSNKTANAALLQELKEQEQARILRLKQYLLNNPSAKTVINYKNGGRKELMDVLPNGEFVYAQTDNAGAALTARANKLYSGGSLGLNIQGQNMIAGVWDGGSARDTHQEFMVNGLSKITILDGSASAEHATHVAGTIAAQGIVTNARGLAFNSSIKSYDWTGDLSEMLIEASSGLLVSNHSYGLGSLSAIWFFGAYDSRARQIDALCYNNPFYLPVFSAGNSRNDTDPPASTQNANKGGYDLVLGHANAKNVMTVAAVAQVSNYVDASSVVMSSFSSWGPSDDGRIKPEISMKGVNVRSTINTSDTAYGTMSGTSMASPGITGVALLLQQYYNQLYSNYMRAATLKGLILHTADEAGSFPGPDYQFGWGLVNAESAAKVIRDKNLSLNRTLIEENTLNNGSSYTKTVNVSGTQPLQVSISWTDPSYPTANSGVTDPNTKYLINDLDVKVTGSDGTVYYPWKLQGMALPYESATNNSTNDVDNYERIDIPNASGTYTITVNHKNSLQSGSQNYSLIVSGANMSVLGTNETEKKSFEIYPNPVKNFIKFNSNSPLKGTVTILESSGRFIQKSELSNNMVDVRNLVPGNYILIFNDNLGKITSHKFIKN